MIIHSSSVSRSGLSKILSGTPILPISCRSAPRRICNNSVSPNPQPGYKLTRQPEVCGNALYLSLFHKPVSLTPPSIGRVLLDPDDGMPQEISVGFPLRKA